MCCWPTLWTAGEDTDTPRQRRAQTVYVRLSHVTASFFRYPYRQLEEPMPDMLVPVDWNEAKRFFTAEATRLLAARTG